MIFFESSHQKKRLLGSLKQIKTCRTYRVIIILQLCGSEKNQTKKRKPTMASVQRDKPQKIDKCRADLAQTEQIMQDIQYGMSLEDISRETGIPAWQLTFRMATYGLQAAKIGALMAHGPPTDSLVHVRSLGTEENKAILVETMAKMMCGVSMHQALEQAKDEKEREILTSRRTVPVSREKAMPREEPTGTLVGKGEIVDDIKKEWPEWCRHFR